ncbi:MAG: hypothetical protein AAF728_02200 [Cyanobacteria bacterium P01_D01_bin.128]
MPEYWIIDPMRKKVSVLVLEQDGYQETVYQGSQAIKVVRRSHHLFFLS